MVTQPSTPRVDVAALGAALDRRTPARLVLDLTDARVREANSLSEQDFTYQGDDRVPDPDRFLVVEPLSYDQGLRLLTGFAERVTDAAVREHLSIVLRTTVPYVEFERYLARHPELEQEWQRHRAAAHRVLGRVAATACARAEHRRRVDGHPRIA